MMGCNISLKGELREFIPKLSLLPLLVWSCVCNGNPGLEPGTTRSVGQCWKKEIMAMFIREGMIEKLLKLQWLLVVNDLKI